MDVRVRLRRPSWLALIQPVLTCFLALRAIGCDFGGKGLQNMDWLTIEEIEQVAEGSKTI